MIGLGSQYLTAAGFGRYRITAASLGNLELIVKNWLTGATQQAILGAFGDDGWAVIKATNAYLNGIAASDRDKAQQIADWLNTYAIEDPKIVYSLVEGIGYRGIVTDGYAYINSKIVAQRDMDFEVEYFSMSTAVATDYSIFGARSSSSYFTMQNINGRLRSAVGNSWVWTNKYFENNKRYLLKRINNNVYVDGVLIDSSSTLYNPNGLETYFFTMNSFATSGPELRSVVFALGYCKVANQLHLVPFKLGIPRSASQTSTGTAQAKDTLGMIDLLTGIFYPNAYTSGTFTELIETPSTPLTANAQISA